MKQEFRRQLPLVLNVVLAIAVVTLAFHKSQRAAAPSARDLSPGRISSEKAASASRFEAGAEPGSRRYPDFASPTDRRRWLIDRLRAAGVPNAVLARVALSDFEAGWQERFDGLTEKGDGDPDAMAALQLQEDLSRDAEMRAALGEEDFKQWDQKKLLREANPGNLPLSASETDAIYALKKKLQQRQLELEEARLNGDMDDAEINDASDQAYSEFNQQMKALLGDNRYAQSQQQDENTAATNLRQDLAKVNPSDSQFQQLLNAQRQLDEQRAQLDKQFQDNPSSPDYAAQITALDEARDQEYQRVLGTNAFDILQKEQDPGYTRMQKYATLWGLDDNKIDYVYGTMKYYEKTVQDYEAQARALASQGQTVDWDTVNRNLQQFAEQTQQSLQTYLGQNSFNEMQRNGIFSFNQ